MKLAHLSKEQLLDVVQQQDEKIAHLEHRLRALLQRQYGKHADDINKNQLSLFEETDFPIEPVEEKKPEDDKVSVAPHQRGKRNKLHDKFERQTFHYELPDEQRQCRCGACLKDIGQETTENFEFIPARFIVEEHIQHRYACPVCQDNVVLAKKPAPLLPKSNAGPGLVAHIATTKFVDGVPLHRQEKQAARLGVNLPRNTMARWLMQVGILAIPLINLLAETLRSGRYLQCDETSFQVLKEKDRAPTALSYMWVMRSTEKERQVVFYHYATSRAGNVILDFLHDYRGHVQCDGYSAYGVLESLGIVLVGCMAHLRRKFVDTLKTTSKKELSQLSKANEAVRYIKQLYAIEAKIRDKDDNQRFAVRQQDAIPVLNQFKQWLEAQSLVVLPKSPLGQAIQYGLNQWSKLIRYCDDGCLEIDNNADERAIRPFCLRAPKLAF